ncbi:lysozyme inhibitor LprI family protein [Jeongeupia wiesaeckerbachi]|uniref:lysozyme inhibitor LprI family protein n=1 Tax=Jeongeupia wiesaeckerbachi TaxID=3051218 RepID=UPI003D8032CF
MTLSHLALVVALLSPAAWSYVGCHQSRDEFDNLDCLNDIYQQANRDLGTSYKTLDRYLDDAGKTALQRSQRDWLGLRKRECSYRNATGFYINFECATRITSKRTAFFADRIRECRYSSCKNNML